MEERKVYGKERSARLKVSSAQLTLRKANAKFKKIKIASSEACEELKIGVEKAWAEIRVAFRKAAFNFK